jgi:hypothetical protein
LFASDFDHTLTFNDSGYILSELLGMPGRIGQISNDPFGTLALLRHGRSKRPPQLLRRDVRENGGCIAPVVIRGREFDNLVE